MGLILIFLAFIAIYLLISMCFNNSDWGKSMIWAAILLGTLIVVITEGLSAIHAISRSGTLAAWSLVDFILIIVIAFKMRQLKLPSFDISNFLIMGKTDKYIIFGIGFILFLTLLLGLILPPYAGDPTCYHLPRILQYEQNHNIGFFPTHDLRQILLNPWAEYALLNIYLLTGNHHTLSLVQWFFWLGSLLVAALIARELCSSGKIKIITIAFAVSIPIGIFESQMPKNDLIMAFFFLCFLWFILRMIKAQSCGRYDCAGAALALALATLTKGHAIFIAIPFLFWVVIKIIHTKPQDILKLFFFIAVAALLLNGPQYLRKINMVGNLQGAVIEGQIWKLFNESHNPKIIITNTVWTLAQVFSTPIEPVNNAISSFAERINAILGVSANDQKTIFSPAEKKVHKNPISGNIIVIIFFITSFIYCVVRRKKGISRTFAMCLIISFCIFCYLFKWDSYLRLLLPITFGACSFIGVTLSNGLEDKKVAVIAYITLFYGFFMFPFIVYNDIGKSEIGKKDIVSYLLRKDTIMTDSNMQSDYEKTAKFITERGYSRIGLFVRHPSNEYALWELIKNQSSPEPRLQHVLVENISNTLSKKHPYSDFTPQCIVFIGSNEKKKQLLAKVPYSKILFETESSLVAGDLK